MASTHQTSWTFSFAVLLFSRKSQKTQTQLQQQQQHHECNLYIFVGWENAKEWKFVVITVNCCFRGRLSRKMSSKNRERKKRELSILCIHML